MSHRTTLARLALASLAAAVLAAAPASAMPADPQGTPAQDPRQQDMHASTVQPADQAPKLDLRGEAAKPGGGTSGGPAREPKLQGPPTCPETARTTKAAGTARAPGTTGSEVTSYGKLSLACQNDHAAPPPRTTAATRRAMGFHRRRVASAPSPPMR